MTTESVKLSASNNSDNDVYKYKTDFFNDFSTFKLIDHTSINYRAVSITQFKELMERIKSSGNQEFCTVLDVFAIDQKWVINTIAIVNSNHEVTHLITGGKPRDGMVRTHVESAIVTKRNDFKVYAKLDSILAEFYPIVNRRRLILSFDLRDQLLGNTRVQIDI